MVKYKQSLQFNVLSSSVMDAQSDSTSELHLRIRLHCVSYELRNRIGHQQILDKHKDTWRYLQSQVINYRHSKQGRGS